MDVRAYYNLPNAYRLAAAAHLGLLADLEDILDYHDDDLINVSGLIAAAHRQQDGELLMEFQRRLQAMLDLRGYWALAVQLNEWACEAALNAGNRVDWAGWTHHRGDIFHQRGQYPRALEAYHLSEGTYLELGRVLQALKSRHQRAMVLRAMGQYRQAWLLCEDTIHQARTLDEPSWIANPYYLRALLARDRGDYPLAEATILESLRLFQAAGNESLAAHCQHFYGELLLLRGRDLTRAGDILRESLATSRRLSIVRRVAATERLLGDLERLSGNLEQAAEYYHRALETCEAIGDRPQKARALFGQALLAYRRADPQTGYGLLRSAASLYDEIGDPRGLAGACLLLVLRSLQRLDLRHTMVFGWRGLWVALRSGLFAPRLLTGALRRWRRF